MVHDLDEREQRMARDYPRFYAALMELGASDAERARRLDVQRMTVAKYRLGLATPRKLIHSSRREPGSQARVTSDADALRARETLMAAWDEDERSVFAA